MRQVINKRHFQDLVHLTEWAEEIHVNSDSEPVGKLFFEFPVTGKIEISFWPRGRHVKVAKLNDIGEVVENIFSDDDMNDIVAELMSNMNSDTLEMFVRERTKEFLQQAALSL
jgi:hypothetical protein